MNKLAFQLGYTQGLRKLAEMPLSSAWADLGTQFVPLGSTALGAVRGTEESRLKPQSSKALNMLTPAVEHALLSSLGSVAGTVGGGIVGGAGGALLADIANLNMDTSINVGMGLGAAGGSVVGGYKGSRLAKLLLERRLKHAVSGD